MKFVARAAFYIHPEWENFCTERVIMNTDKINVDLQLLKKYDRPGPRYTSYPTAPNFHDGITEKEYVKHITNGPGRQEGKNISLYFHLPFCDSRCYFCGCNMLVTRNKDKIDTYIDFLEKEVKMLRPTIGEKRKISQLHWGGGTPTSLSPNQIRRLGSIIHSHFEFENKAELSVEIDPRELTREHVVALSESGFNRCSLGVQDFDPKVQQTVNRIQPESITQQTIQWARELGFISVNIDLMYGLPFQRVDSFNRTIDKTIAFNPDRLAVFNYAHLPKVIKRQRIIKDEWLPSPEEKLFLLKASIEKLTAAGYVYIGMDHFAKPEDELTVAMTEGTLYRNFQGYSTFAGLDLFALGMSSISMLSDLYVQNYKTLAEYYKALDGNNLPIMRGVELTAEDIMRRDVITELMCNFRLDKNKIESKYHIEFDKHFVNALKALDEFEKDDLVTLDDNEIIVTKAGRLLIRNIAMNFDEYLSKKQSNQPQFSRTV
jgi:oxygen-independent coproporphyrinogen III oxidase